MIKQWKCNQAAYVNGYGIVRPGRVIEFEEGQEPGIVIADFECMTPSQVKEDEEKKIEDNDLTFAAKVEKLKDMKVKLPRGLKKTEVERLFNEFVAKVELPDIVR